MNARLISRCCVVVWMCALGACGAKKPQEPLTPTVVADAGAPPAPEPEPAPKTLYDRLGGKEGVAAVVESLVKYVATDPQLKKVFAKTTGPKLDAFKKNLADQLCEATDGGCKYQGKEMKAAHTGMGITEAQWDKFVSMLTAALNEQKVADNEQSELLAKLAPMKDLIVAAKKK